MFFCFQEVYNNADIALVGSEYYQDAFNLHADISSVLSEHNGYFRPSLGETYGLAMFVRKDIKVEVEDHMFVHEIPNYIGGGNHPRNLQYIEIGNGDNKVTIANVHGLWNGQGKTDTEDRIKQSKEIKKFLDSTEGKVVLCGDFNLLPQTESLKIVESGMRNLISEYNITSTRTSLYTKEHKFADYIFTSPNIKVIDFKVMPDEVSDHSPLYLEIG